MPEKKKKVDDHEQAEVAHPVPLSEIPVVCLEFKKLVHRFAYIEYELSRLSAAHALFLYVMRSLIFMNLVIVIFLQKIKIIIYPIYSTIEHRYLEKCILSVHNLWTHTKIAAT